MGLKKEDLEGIKASVRAELDHHKRQLDYHTTKVEELSRVVEALDQIEPEED